MIKVYMYKMLYI